MRRALNSSLNIAVWGGSERSATDRTKEKGEGVYKCNGNTAWSLRGIVNKARGA